MLTGGEKTTILEVLGCGTKEGFASVPVRSSDLTIVKP